MPGEPRDNFYTCAFVNIDKKHFDPLSNVKFISTMIWNVLQFVALNGTEKLLLCQMAILDLTISTSREDKKIVFTNRIKHVKWRTFVFFLGLT